MGLSAEVEVRRGGKNNVPTFNGTVHSARGLRKPERQLVTKCHINFEQMNEFKIFPITH